MAKNRITYAAILTMIIIFIGLYDRPAAYTALYAVILMPVLSFLLSLFLFSAKKYIYISERLSSTAIKKGGKVQYYLTVTNTGRFSCRNVKVVLQKDKRITVDSKARIFSLPSRGICEIEFEMSGRYRGIFNVGISDIWLYDPLGLFRFRKKISGGVTLTVMPEAVPLAGLPLMHDNVAGSVNSPNNKARLPEEDRAEISGLRDYIPGDGYKRIHWKLSAKKNKLISKTYRIMPEKTIMLMVDNSKFLKSAGGEADRCEDGLIEAVVSVLSHCAEKHFNIILRCMDRETHVSSQQFEDLYAAAANVEFKADGRFDEFFSGTANNRRDVETIFVFMRELTDLFCDSVNAFLPERNIVVFYCPAKKYADEKRRIDSLRASGAVCYIISDKISVAQALKDCA